MLHSTTNHATRELRKSQGGSRLQPGAVPSPVNFESSLPPPGAPADAVPVIKETHLSRKPANGSGAVAIASVFVLLGTSVLYWTNALGLASLLPASRQSVFIEGEYWRLLTTLGVHASFEHFLSNAIVFAVLAYLLHGYYGPVVYPAWSVALGAVVTAIALTTYPPLTDLVGASGLVYLMAAFWLTLYLLVERRLSLGKRLIRAVGFGLIVLAPTAIEPQVSYRTHALGFAAGILLALAYFSKKKEMLRAHERVEWE